MRSPCPQKHGPPLTSIPCLHYRKMKDSEERERAAGIAPPEPELPPDEPDPLGTDAGPPDEKDPLGAEAAPGALGQVKAKVEVCKDESVGKRQANSVPKEEAPSVPARPRAQETRPPTGAAAQTAFGHDRRASWRGVCACWSWVPLLGWVQPLSQPRGCPQSWVTPPWPTSLMWGQLS